MKTSSIKKIAFYAALALFAGLPTYYAQAEGGANGGGGKNTGGGGDYTETLINDIRMDIVDWISKGGARRLVLPTRINYATYLDNMSMVLAPHFVVIGAISTAEEQKTKDPDLKVEVNGQPKTCRAKVWKKDKRPHILCNIERFLQTPENERYPLVHHEYAGLIGVEQNIGASSDYEISNQLSGFLEHQLVLRLAVKEKRAPRPNNGCVPLQGSNCLAHRGLYDGQEFKITQDFFISLSSQNFFANGRQIRSGKLMKQEGQSYCKMGVATDGMNPGNSQLLPKSLLTGDGFVLVPANISPYEVTDVSWYVPSVFIGSAIKGERFGLWITCGKVEQGALVESKATALSEILQAFQRYISRASIV